MGPGAGRRTLRATVGAIFLALAVAPLRSQSSTSAHSFDDLIPELAARIIAAVAPGTQVSLDLPAEDVTLANDLSTRLASAGVRAVASATGIPAVSVSCATNLRERVCSAEIGATTRRTMIVTRPHQIGLSQAAVRVALELRLLLSQRVRLLDVARVGDRLLVLGPSALTQYEQTEGSWRDAVSRPIPTNRPWPRDVRGRLRVLSGRVEAFLPGMHCAGSVDLQALACAEEIAPWPLDIERATLDSTRNFFRTDGGFTFYGIARLPTDSGARWVAASVDRTLLFVDERRQSSVTSVTGEDVVAIRAPCVDRWYVVVASADADRHEDRLTLFDLAPDRLLAAASPLRLQGRLTALWRSTSADAATVITWDADADRYDAFELAVSCSR